MPPPTRPSDHSHRILGIGNPFVDTVVHIDEAYLERQGLVKGSFSSTDREGFATLLAEVGRGAMTYPGGSGANVIRGLAHLGWPCTLAGRVGDDPAGHWLDENFRSLGIEMQCRKSTAGTAQALCLVTGDGERTMRDYLGASAEMSSADLSPELFENKRLVHIEGYSILWGDVAERAMAMARQASAGTGTAIAFDLANFEIVEQYGAAIEKLLTDYVTICFANAQEATALTQQPPREACQLLARRCRYAVVTCGGDGCYVAWGDDSVHLPAHSVANIVDTTGAGDLFACGFLDGWLRDLPPPQCAEQGHLLAAAVIQREGASI